MIITIDGPAGSGKSTVAKKIAEKLGFDYFDTGAMYRAVTWYFLENNIDYKDEKSVHEALNFFEYEIQTLKGEKKYLVNGKDISKEIRLHDVTEKVSEVAIYPYIRTEIVKIQRKFASVNNAVFEGRDMGTVVFPYADLKFYLSATPEIRAERRYNELLEKFPEFSKTTKYQKILSDIKKRDENDSTRKVSPLKPAEDSIIIDSSKKSVSDVVNCIHKKTEKVIKRKKSCRPYFSQMKLFYKIVLFMSWLYFKLFYSLKVYGIENFIKGPAIIASNHVSFYDPPLLAVSSHEEVHFLAKESLFKIFFFGKIIRKLNSHPLSRRASDASTLKRIIKLLKSGKKVILFPEGERSFDNKIGSIEPGMGFITYMSKCSIIPAYIDGAFDVWPRSKRFPKIFGKISVYFGEPINPLLFQDMKKTEFINIINQNLEESLKKLKNKAMRK